MTGDGIRLWLARPADCNVQVLLPVLAPAELARARRYRFTEDHDAFVVAHAMRRSELARLLATDPGNLRFGQTEKGRPKLLHAAAGSLAFSASRRRRLVAFALGYSCRLGVDVEQVGTVDDPDALLGKFLAPGTIAGLSGLSGALLNHRFAQLWTITEACAKARGTGLETFSPRLTVHWEASHAAVVKDVDANWFCHLADPDDDHCVAVACDRDPRAPILQADWRHV